MAVIKILIFLQISCVKNLKSEMRNYVLTQLAKKESENYFWNYVYPAEYNFRMNLVLLNNNSNILSIMSMTKLECNGENTYLAGDMYRFSVRCNFENTDEFTDYVWYYHSNEYGNVSRAELESNGNRKALVISRTKSDFRFTKSDSRIIFPPFPEFSLLIPEKMSLADENKFILHGADDRCQNLEVNGRTFNDMPLAQSYTLACRDHYVIKFSANLISSRKQKN